MSAPPPRVDPVAPLVQRLVAASGVVFAILLVILIALTQAETPDEGAPLAEWTEFASDNEDKLRIGALIGGLAAYNFLLFLGYLRSALGEAERAARGFTRGGYIILAAGAVGIAGLALGTFLGSAITQPDTPPETLRGLEHLPEVGFLLASAGLGACLVTTGLLNAGVRALPGWLGSVALAAGLAFVLQLGVLLSEERDNFFGIFYPLGFLLLVIFTAGASVHFLREQTRPLAAPPPPA